MKITKEGLISYLRGTATVIDSKVSVLMDNEVTTASQTKLLKLCIQGDLMETLITKINNRFEEVDNV